MRENYGTMPIAEIAAALGRSYSSVTGNAVKLGVRTRPGRVAWTEAEDAYLRENRATTTTKKLAEHLGRPWSSVRQRATDLGLTNVNVQAQLVRRSEIRHGYFGEIDSPLKAYVLGWLASDGWISGNEVCIRLHEKDAAAVELIRDQLAPLHLVRRQLAGECPMASFRVTSDQMRGDLHRLGVTSRKSLTIRYPRGLPVRYTNSFILGCFDGDGCLYRVTPNCYNWSLLSASRPFLLEVQDRVFAATDVQLRGPYRPSKDNSALRIECRGAAARTVDAWVHADVPGLARKSLASRAGN